MIAHDDDLAREHPAPGEVRRAEAADQWPDRDRDGARRSDEAVRGRAARLGEVAGDERDDRRQDQRGADALEEGPADQQDGEARRQRRRQRPCAVDHAADRERPLAADDRPDLGAGDHQRRHHERVGGDRALDPGHGRSDVLGDRRDRDVHDAAVQRHQELRRREGQENELRAAAGLLGGLSRRDRLRSRHGENCAPPVGSRRHAAGMKPSSGLDAVCERDTLSGGGVSLVCGNRRSVVWLRNEQSLSQLRWTGSMSDDCDVIRTGRCGLVQRRGPGDRTKACGRRRR